MLFSQTGVLADNFYGSMMGPGVISALSFARKLVDLPLLVVSYSISVVVFPYFAGLHIENDKESSTRLLRRLLRLTMILFALVTSVTVPLSRDLVSAAFGGGAFGDRSVEMTSPILAWYAIGFVPLAIESIIVMHFFARRDVIRPVAAGMAAVVLHVAIVATTWSWLGPRSIAAGYVVAKTLKVVYLLRSSHVWRPSLAGESGFLLRLLIVGAASGLLVVKLSSIPTVALWAPILRVFLLGLAATVAFGVGSYLTRIVRFTRTSPR
jgi:putative peptidoglycan lipid II flippase